MYRMGLTLVSGIVVLALLAGCGGSGGGGAQAPLPGGQDGGPVVQAAGPVTIQAASGFKSFVQEGSYSTLFAVYGTKITRLEYRPPKSRLVGTSWALDKIFVSAEDGTGKSTVFEPGSCEEVCWLTNEVIAFIENHASGPSTLHVMNADGSGAREIKVKNANGFYSVTNGSLGDIIFSGIDPSNTISIGAVSRYDRVTTAIWWTDDTHNDRDPDPCPVTDTIAWVRSSGGGDDYDLVMAPDSSMSSVTTLMDDNKNQYRPRWSPDGRYIAYITEETSGHYSVCVYDTQLSMYSTLSSTTYTKVHLDWTSDGRYILFTGDGNLYRIRPDGGSTEELVKSSWGRGLDAYTPNHYKYRVFIGPSGSDWAGNNPPFGTQRLGALVVYSDFSAPSTAVTFSVSSGDALTLRDRSSDYKGFGLVEVRAGHLHRVLADNGPGIAKTIWDLDQGGKSPGAALLTISDSPVAITSVIPIWDQASSAAAGPRPKIERQGDRVVISGAQMQVYDGQGRLVSGPGPVQQVILDSRTGEPVL